MAKVVTQTGLTHYEVQKRRRADKVQESRVQRSPVVIHPSDVVMIDTPRRMRTGIYMGRDGDRPTRVLDAAQHELYPDSTTTVHRHSWEAIMFITEGSGWTEINGRRIEWHPWDTIYLPPWAWHRHGNTSSKKAQYITWGVGPMHETFGTAVLEESGDTPYGQLPPPPPRSTAGSGGLDPYSRRMARLAAAQRNPEDYRLNTRWEDITPRVTKRGARSTFLVDQAIGYRTSGLTAVMHELGPGKWQARHRHGGEAWLQVIKGHGHTEVDGEPFEWAEGDLVVVDHWCWHQHFNDDLESSSRLIRVHNFDSLYDLMRILLDPVELIEEDPELVAPDLTGFDWPDPYEGRPVF